MSEIERAIECLEARRDYWRDSARKQAVNDQISDPDATAMRCMSVADGLFEAIEILRRREWEQGQ